jgi:hypothetical protein
MESSLCVKEERPAGKVAGWAERRSDAKEPRDPPEVRNEKP